MPDDLPESIGLRPYFFDRGIRFQCQRCGQCCTGSPGTIFVTRSEARAIARYRDTDPVTFENQCLYPYKSAFSIKEHRDGRCLFFNSDCTIYPMRPNQCRTFPFWFSNLRSKRSWQKIAAACPGIGQGPLFTRRQILVLARTTLQQ